MVSETIPFAHTPLLYTSTVLVCHVYVRVHLSEEA